jgi:hypothetical protein
MHISTKEFYMMTAINSDLSTSNANSLPDAQRLPMPEANTSLVVKIVGMVLVVTAAVYMVNLQGQAAAPEGLANGATTANIVKVLFKPI